MYIKFHVHSLEKRPLSYEYIDEFFSVFFEYYNCLFGISQHPSADSEFALFRNTPKNYPMKSFSIYAI